MTPREQIAFAAGIEAARQAALTAAVTIEVRDDASEVRQRAAVAALTDLAEGLRTMLAPTVSPTVLSEADTATISQASPPPVI